MTTTLKEVVDAYIELGATRGYFFSEAILTRHLPDSDPGGSCADVLPEKREAFLHELRCAIRNGVYIARDTFVIFEDAERENVEEAQRKGSTEGLTEREMFLFEVSI